MSNFTLADGSWEWITISKREAVEFAKYISEHAECYAIGIYRSGASGIGQNLVVECHKCKKASQRDITDYTEW